MKYLDSTIAEYPDTINLINTRSKLEEIWGKNLGKNLGNLGTGNLGTEIWGQKSGDTI